MNDLIFSVAAGRSAGLEWPSYLHPRLKHPEYVLARQDHPDRDDAACATSSWLPSTLLPRPSWALPLADFAPTRHLPHEAYIDELLSDTVGEAAIPKQLLRQLLHESCSPVALHNDMLLHGNCLAAAVHGANILVLHPSGACGEQLTLSVLRPGTEPEPWQCNQVARLPGSGMPIQQIALSQPQADSQAPSATQAAHYFIAIRAHFWLCFATISGPAEDAAAGSTQTADAPDNHQADSAWQLQALYASQSHVRLAHVAWNRRRPALAAYMCEDFSLHVTDLQLDCCKTPAGIGQGYSSLQARAVPVPEQRAEQGCRPMCVWGPCPHLIFSIAGRRLLRHDTRSVSAACPCIHERTQGDPFVSIAASTEAGSNDLQYLLAASTMLHVLLFDVRSAVQPQLIWQHGMQQEPPCLLTILPSVSPEEGSHAAADKQWHSDLSAHQQAQSERPVSFSQTHFSQAGSNALPWASQSQTFASPGLNLASQQAMTQASQAAEVSMQPHSTAQPSTQVYCTLVACNMGLGQAVSMQCSIEEAEVQVAAMLPGSEGLGQDKQSAGVWLQQAEEQRGCLRLTSSGMVQHGRAAFTWAPHARRAAKALDLPHQLYCPLRSHHKAQVAAQLPDSMRLLDEGHAELLQSSADLQGCCLLPWALSSPSAIGRVTAPVDGSSQSGQLLVLRLDALGSIHLHINRHGDDTEGRQSITNVQPAFCISPPMQLLVQLGSSAAGEEDGQPAVGAASPTPPAMTPDQAAKAAITPQDTWSEWHAQTLQMRQNAARRNAKVAGRARAAQAGSTVELPQHFAAVQQAVLSGTDQIRQEIDPSSSMTPLLRQALESRKVASTVQEYACCAADIGQLSGQNAGLLAAQAIAGWQQLLVPAAEGKTGVKTAEDKALLPDGLAAERLGHQTWDPGTSSHGQVSPASMLEDTRISVPAWQLPVPLWPHLERSDDAEPGVAGHFIAASQASNAHWTSWQEGATELGQPLQPFSEPSRHVPGLVKLGWPWALPGAGRLHADAGGQQALPEIPQPVVSEHVSALLGRFQDQWTAFEAQMQGGPPQQPASQYATPGPAGPSPETPNPEGLPVLTSAAAKMQLAHQDGAGAKGSPLHRKAVKRRVQEL